MREDHVAEAARAHTNLTMMHAIIGLCEGGCIYGPLPAASRIIREAKAEAARQLRLYDRHRKTIATLTKDTENGN